VSLAQHLEKQPARPESEPEEDELEFLGETEAKEAERIKQERAAFRARIERASGRHDVSLDEVTRALPGGTPSTVPGSVAPPAELTDEVERVASRRSPLLMVLGAGALVVLGGVGVVLMSRRPPKEPEVVSAPATTAVAAVEPAVAQKPPVAEGKPAEAKAETAPEAESKSEAAAKQHRPAHKAKQHLAGAPETTTPTPKPTLPHPMGPKPAPLAAIQTEVHKEPPAPVKMEGEGTLLLASSPWCNVKIDGVNRGPTPLNVKLSAGQHTVVLSNPEFKINRTVPVVVMPNQTTKKRYDF